MEDKIIYETELGEELSYVGNDEGYSDIADTHPVLGGIATLGVLIVMFFVGRYLVGLPVCEECMKKGGGLAGGKLYELTHLLFDLEIGKKFFIVLAILTGIGMTGLFAGLMDDALCLLPLGRLLKQKAGFYIFPVLRFLPCIIMAVYMLIVLFWRMFQENAVFDIEKYSLTGKGYTAAMWVTQITYILVILSAVFLVIEALVNSGILGCIVRLPLLVMTNASLLVSLIFASFFALIFIILLIAVIAFVSFLKGILFAYAVGYRS